ncbi:MAG: type I-C CRISPR-associated protein Cas5c [Thermodesulfobacteriota bacterium]
MSYGVKLKVWGDLASFNRPEMKVERVSYEVMTPSAARGVLEAIYWKPEMKWIVDAIHVLNPIRFTHIRRNEIDCKVPAGTVGTAMKGRRGDLGIVIEDHRQQRAAMVLREVCYGIQAHVEVLDLGDSSGSPEAKHLEMFKRRAQKGQCFHHPYLGCREFPAAFELVETFPPCPDELKGERDLGFILHDIAFLPDKAGTVIESGDGARLRAEPRFFRARLVNGVIQVPPMQEARA